MGRMKIPLHQVDAFTDALFAGNPAAVCPLDAWLPAALMQDIAAENALSETAFVVPEGTAFAIRWFTPAREVDLCGHATLASAWVLFERLGVPGDRLVFSSRSGPLPVRREGDAIVLDFPADRVRPVALDEALVAALGARPRALHAGRYDLAVLDDEAAVRALAPDMRALAARGRHVCVTAPGDAPDVDVVSRFFAPAAGIDEDPVTGSAHCLLTPYWSERLGRRELRARQASRRGGALLCRDRGDRVELVGRVVPYLEGTLTV